MARGHFVYKNGADGTKYTYTDYGSSSSDQRYIRPQVDIEINGIPFLHLQKRHGIIIFLEYHMDRVVGLSDKIV